MSTFAPARIPSPLDATPRVVRHGDGDRIFVALHGWSGSHRSFDPLLPHLPPGATLWSFDQPGFGQTASPPKWELPTLLDLLEPVAQADDRPFTVLGVSGGAIVALLWALRLEHRVERLVLLDPFAFVPWYFRIFTLPVFGTLLYFAVFANPLGRALTNAGLKPHRTTYDDLVGGFRGARHLDNLRYLRCLSRAVTVTPERIPFEGRVDILYGERTFRAVRRSLPLWKAALPQARCIEVPGAGHLPIFEAPGAVAKRVFEPD